MATYVKEFNGYVADVPRLWFKRCDGRVFYFDELTQATVTPQVNYTEINAGWSLYPVAYLPGQSTFEMSITSGKFEADLFVMANATNFEENKAYQMPITEVLTLDGMNEVDLAKTPISGSVSIAGLEETAQTPSKGKFKVDTSGEVVKIQFFAGDVENEVTVSYFYAVEAQEANIDNRSSARGEAIMKYPVYGSGENCTDSSIIGYVLVRVYNARVTQAPGFDASYKTANTFGFTLAAMDAKRPDEATYSIAFVGKDA
jgi:hypothetical protein